MKPMIYAGAGVLALAALVFALTRQEQPVHAEGGSETVVQPGSPRTDAEALAEAGAVVEDADDDALDLGQTPDLSGIEPLKGANNVPYRTCVKPPDLVEVLGRRGTETYARRQHLDRYLRMTNVLATKDCSCSGKLVPASAILAFEEKLMVQAGATDPAQLITRPLYDESRQLAAQVEQLCGGEY